MMKLHSIFISALLALALSAQTANAAIIFTAILKPVGGVSVPGNGMVKIVAEDADVSWQVNVTDVVGLAQLQIVDGMGDGSVEGVTLKTLDPPVSGNQTMEGSFNANDLNPAVARNVMELAGHVCMGHIYAAAKMESGQMLMGKLVYVPEQGSTVSCEDAVPGEHGTSATGDDHSIDAAAASPPASSSVSFSAASRTAVAVLAALFSVVLL